MLFEVILKIILAKIHLYCAKYACRPGINYSNLHISIGNLLVVLVFGLDLGPRQNFGISTQLIEVRFFHSQQSEKICCMNLNENLILCGERLNILRKDSRILKICREAQPRNLSSGWIRITIFCENKIICLPIKSL